MPDAIQWKRRLAPEEMDRILDALTRKLRGRVDEAWVFGSFATGTAVEASDCDLVLVADPDLPFWERPRTFDDLYDVVSRLDLLVYAPEEFAALLEAPSSFWRSFRETRRRLV